MAHPCDRYFAKHQHYPRIRKRNGASKLTVEFAPGYVRITNGPPYSGTVYITRSAWMEVLKAIIPLTKWWLKFSHDDFDVPKAMADSLAFEAKLLTERREAKKTRHWDTAAADRQRKRFQAAKARARSRRERT
jgi:hypothetical protein